MSEAISDTSSCSNTSESATDNAGSARNESYETECDNPDYVEAFSHIEGYADEPLALPGEDNASDETDEDGLSPEVLERRSEGTMPLNEW
jgi:hypothetical protein